jgi:anti-anti-sigma factor
MPVSFSIADSSGGPRKVVIWVSGDLDADTGRAVRARLGQAQRHAESDVILDLSTVTFIDSPALASIVNGAKAMSEVGKLRVISPPERIARVLTDAGMGELFELMPDRRGEREDRRKRDVPVAVERRSGDRRVRPDGANGNHTTGATLDPRQRP